MTKLNVESVKANPFQVAVFGVLVLAIVLLLGNSASAASPQLSPKVFDASGSAIGYVTDTSGFFPSIVATDGMMQFLDKTLNVIEKADDAGNIHPVADTSDYDASSKIYYASSDCSGQGYLKTSNSVPNSLSYSLFSCQEPQRVHPRDLSLEKVAYLPNEVINVTCHVANQFQLYDITPGIDGVVSQNGYLGRYQCSDPLQFGNLDGHLYAIIQTTSADCDNQNYVVCKTFNSSGFGEVDFHVTNSPLPTATYIADKSISVPGNLSYQSDRIGNFCTSESGAVVSPIPVKNVQSTIDSYATPFRISL